MANTISGVTKLNGVPTQARVTLINVLTNTIAGSKLSDGADAGAANVSSLLHFDGANGSTTFTDEKGLVWTPASNAKIDTDISKFGGASGLFDGVADNITTPATAAMGFGSGDYTVEGWLYQANEAVDRCIFDNRGGGAEGIAIYSSTTGVDNVRRLVLANNVAIIAGTGTAQFPVNTWSHWAVCRSGSTVRGFIDGVQSWSVTDSRTLASSAPAIIGANNATGQEFVGRLDEMRVTKGFARYTANFTPPTAPFTLGAASGAFSFTGLAAGRYELLTLIPGYKALVDGPWVLDGVAAPVTDDFNTDTLAQYTQYADVNASWGVVSGQMTATGGGASQAVLTRNGVSFADGSVSCNMNYASDAGLVLRLQDNNNYYVATINDGGSMVSPQNTVRIYKRVGGAFTQLGTNVTISFSRNTNHDFKFTASGTSLEVHFDGVSILSVTDSSLSAAGKAGMRHNGAADPNGSKFNSFSWPSS